MAQCLSTQCDMSSIKLFVYLLLFLPEKKARPLPLKMLTYWLSSLHEFCKGETNFSLNL